MASDVAAILKMEQFPIFKKMDKQIKTGVCTLYNSEGPVSITLAHMKEKR